MSKQGIFKQHFVPQLLLRRFADKRERLWAYDKVTDNVFPTTVEDAAQKHNWFTLPGIDPVDAPGLAAEKYFGAYEEPAAQAIDDIVCGIKYGIRNLIDADRRAALSRYLVLQWMRTPRARHRAIGMMKLLSQTTTIMAEKMGGFAPSEDVRVPETKTEEKLLHISMLHPDQIQEYAKIVYNHVWLILGNDTQSEFYLGDHPVALYSHARTSGTRGVGLATYGTEVSMPLGSRLLLVAAERKWVQNNTPMWLYMEDGLADRLKDPEHVAFYRSLQVREAGRFLYCGSDDFDLAKEQCSAHPDLRDPNRTQWVGYAAGEEIRF